MRLCRYLENKCSRRQPDVTELIWLSLVKVHFYSVESHSMPSTTTTTTTTHIHRTTTLQWPTVSREWMLGVYHSWNSGDLAEAAEGFGEPFEIWYHFCIVDQQHRPSWVTNSAVLSRITPSLMSLTTTASSFTGRSHFCLPPSIVWVVTFT